MREPIGKQDQYIAAFGGLTCFHFLPDQPVRVERLRTSEDTLAELEDHLLLFFTGYSRSASAILKDQNERSNRNDSEMLENLRYVKELGGVTEFIAERLAQLGVRPGVRWRATLWLKQRRARRREQK